jgi:VIT1/CCC1 family predicted Fe2+/Mn2+ transporter
MSFAYDRRFTYRLLADIERMLINDFSSIKNMLDEETRKSIICAQRNEITEYYVYSKLSIASKNPDNRKVLRSISEDELRHYDFWKSYSQIDIKPNNLKIWFYFLISRIFGITFGIKMMERGEGNAQVVYNRISKILPEAESLVKEEEEHELMLLKLIDEEKLRYVSSMVLGLNDALVELTGTLAGLTFALQNTQLIAMVGLITGIAASLSMATSEYLSTKSEGIEKNPLKASIYTGITYLLTVLILVFPYLILENFYFCLVATILNAIFIIFIFTFYISVAKDLSFKNRFFEMVIISLGIATLSFGIGFLVKIFLNIEI